MTNTTLTQQEVRNIVKEVFAKHSVEYSALYSNPRKTVSKNVIEGKTLKYYGVYGVKKAHQGVLATSNPAAVTAALNALNESLNHLNLEAIYTPFNPMLQSRAHITISFK